MINLILLILLGIGFCVSLYAFSIEQKIATNPQYKPACNISDRISCTKPLLSAYGKLLGFSNSIVGLLFYPTMATLLFVGEDLLLLIGAVGSCIFTIYLAYILFAKVKALCLICLTIYAVNLCTLVAALYKYYGWT